MPQIVKCGLIQASHACSTDEKHRDDPRGEHREAREADRAAPAREGVQILCMQEIFTGPYFCAEQNAALVRRRRAHPGRADDAADAGAGEEARMVIVVPLYEEETTGVYYNTAAVIDADGTYLGKYRKNHIPQCAPGLLGEVLLPARQPRLPGVRDAVRERSASTSATTATFPRARASSGSNGAEIVFNPSATVAGLSEYLWKLEQPAHAVANAFFVGAINRVGHEAPWNIGEFYGQSYFCDPRGQIARRGIARPRRAGDRGARPRPDPRGAERVAVLPRPAAGDLRWTVQAVVRTDCARSRFAKRPLLHAVLVAIACAAVADTVVAQAAPGKAKPRARELGVSALIGGVAGPLDAISDVAGVEVGHTTLVSGSGRLVVGQGPVRTGVTVVHPRGKGSGDPVFGAWFTLNGNGEMTGTTWLDESGVLEGPVAITNTHSVGVVRDAILQWQVQRPGLQPWGLPVVAETYDGFLNDINGFHVKPEHVLSALDGAATGAVAEGNVGGGTGMVCHGFKGGIGTASRKLDATAGGYTVGVLVQCNYGLRHDLRVAGVPVGEEITDLRACSASADTAVNRGRPRCVAAKPASTPETEQGSIIVVVATDAPLLPHQLKRVVRRVALGVGRMGGYGGNSSGDIFIAFSTANAGTVGRDTGTVRMEMLPNPRINPLFYATVQATEEAILNAMLAAETMTGANDLRVSALPPDRLLAALRKYGRVPKP